jgi:arylsulfatase A-like enzyme
MGTLRIGRTIAESTPEFARLPRAPHNAPNVVVIVLDDTGFGQLGCFGSDIATPHIDALAAGGLRFNRFHVTALCSPTRASLLTGRNHHSVGMGFLPDVPIGFPGYNGRIPDGIATLPRVLRANGYSTFAVGKWHLAPRWELSASGPFDRWPLGLGFERYYGFLGGDTNQFAPELVRDNGFVEPPRSAADGYHLTEDLADQAVRLVLDQQHATPGKPFFLYFATGAMHAPHHAPREWIDRYAGQFDAGWDAWRDEVFARQQALGVVPPGTALPPRPSWVDEWASLPSDRQRLFARMMEVFAGFLSHTDAQIGRLLGSLERLGVLDDTIVLLLSDNGTSAEGGPHGSLNEHRFTHDMIDDVDDTIARLDDLGGPRAYNHYAWGWAWAGNTPMRLWKRYTWLGGVRTPLVVRWPNGLNASGEIRNQFAHVVDVMPTLLDCIGIDAPAGMHGASLRPALTAADAPNPRATQYFEMLGSRAIYHDGWKAVTNHIGKQLTVERELLEGSLDFDNDAWSLFHLDADFSEADDLAASEPARLTDMIERWWTEAGRFGVLPLDDTFTGRAVALEPRPFLPAHRTRYLPGGGPISEDALPPLGAGCLLRATVDAVADGTLCALGDWNNGFAFYVQGGELVLALNLFGDLTKLTAPIPSEHASKDRLGDGLLTHVRRVLGFDYRRGRGDARTLALTADGVDLVSIALNRDLPFRWQIAGGGFTVGFDRGLPVCDDYEPPFEYTGGLRELEIEIPLLAPRTAPTAETIARALHHE